MKQGSIKVGFVYATRVGDGIAIDVKSYKGHTKFIVVGPLPRGICIVPARDVQLELSAAEAAKAYDRAKEIGYGELADKAKANQEKSP